MICELYIRKLGIKKSKRGSANQVIFNLSLNYVTNLREIPGQTDISSLHIMGDGFLYPYDMLLIHKDLQRIKTILDYGCSVQIICPHVPINYWRFFE